MSTLSALTMMSFSEVYTSPKEPHIFQQHRDIFPPLLCSVPPSLPAHTCFVRLLWNPFIKVFECYLFLFSIKVSFVLYWSQCQAASYCLYNCLTWHRENGGKRFLLPTPLPSFYFSSCKWLLQFRLTIGKGNGSETCKKITVSTLETQRY